MPVVAILSAKGGVGKTTLAVNVACQLHREGERVLLVDTDPQRSLRSWSSRRGEETDLPGVVAVEEERDLKAELPTLASGYDFTVIDGAGRVEGVTGAVVHVADAVLLPVRPSPLDLWASGSAANVVKARRELTGGEPLAAFVVSAAPVGTNVSDQVTDALASYELPTLEARTSYRVAYAETLIAGSAVVLEAPSSKAAGEIEAITGELKDLLTATYT